MPDIRDLIPQPPWEGPPLPRSISSQWPWLYRQQKTVEQPMVQYGACSHGIECIKNHMLRAHLYMSEALRFSSGGIITEEAQQKVRQAKEQLLCEDDFQQAMDAPAATKAEMLKLLASTRSTWKGIDKSGIDSGFGSVDDIREVADSIQRLYRKAYEIDKQYRLSKRV